MPDWVPDWLAALTIADVAGFLVVMGALMGAIVKIGLPIWKALMSLHDVIDTWRGTPEVRDASGAVTQQAQAGIDARLERMERSHDRLMGKVDHLTEMLTDSLANQGDLQGRLANIDTRLDEHSGKLHTPAQLAEHERRRRPPTFTD